MSLAGKVEKCNDFLQIFGIKFWNNFLDHIACPFHGQAWSFRSSPSNTLRVKKREKHLVSVCVCVEKICEIPRKCGQDSARIGAKIAKKLYNCDFV